MTAVFAVETGESLSQITAAIEFLHDFNGVGSERSVGFAVRAFVLDLEIIPTVVDDLPER